MSGTVNQTTLDRIKFEKEKKICCPLDIQVQSNTNTKTQLAY